MYGSSRLGVYNQSIYDPLQSTNVDDPSLLGTYQRVMRKKNYELSDHLGNVIAVISDLKRGINDGSGNLKYYSADVVSATDYYPFGMQMPGRIYNGGGYKFGFNGKENDNEVEGTGNWQDYGMRLYSSRLGRFPTVDQLFKKYPFYSPYHYSSNSPIISIDIDGLESNKILNYIETGKTAASAFLDGLFGDNIGTPLGQSGSTTDIARSHPQTKFNATDVVLNIISFGGYGVGKSFRRAYDQYNSTTDPAKKANALGKATGTAAQTVVALAPVVKAATAASATETIVQNEEMNTIPVIGESTSLPNTFASGATKLMSSEMINKYPNSPTYGNPVETFVAPSAEIDALLSKGLSRSEIKTRLGITDESFLKGDLIRVDIKASELKNLNLRSTTGNEVGANSQFISGGKTAGGVSEAIVDGIPVKGKGVSVSIVKTKK